MSNNFHSNAEIIVKANVTGEIFECKEGLSFWGGVDPSTGCIVDVHHINNGNSLVGKLVLMPTSRGSCSGSGVLLQLMQNGLAPKALIFHEEEEILTLGAIVSDQLFNKKVAILRVSKDIYSDLATEDTAEIFENTLVCGSKTIKLWGLGTETLNLNSTDRRMLNGDQGIANKIAMEAICKMAAVQSANELIDVTKGHIDGCILAHDANLIFAEKMYKLGANVSIPTTINAISVNLNNWENQGVEPDFGNKASRLANAYEKMGAHPTYTCAPYLLENKPQRDEVIGWSESNAVIYANSILGAKTQKHPDYLDLFIAMTGRAPKAGVYLTENRIPKIEISIHLPTDFDDSIWPMLGWLIGDLKNFNITKQHLAKLWNKFNYADLRVDLVAIGSPHASLTECQSFVKFFDGKNCNPNVKTIITIGRDILSKAKSEGLVEKITSAGVQIISDICWCSITEPIFPPEASVIMTNSGKYAHYAHGLTGRKTRFGSLKDCAIAAQSGWAKSELPEWLSN
jgi:predicted aconitase/predicted aconitase with swiveling domain